MTKKRPLDLSRYTRENNTTSPRRTAFDALVTAEPEEIEQRATELGYPLKHISTEQIAPDLHQLRRLPHPYSLREMVERGDRAAEAILGELHDLGTSMKEHGQLQPIIVYPDSGEPSFPQMTHRIIMGQRRWSAALLTGLPTLWAVEVEKPSPIKRILHQFDENEQRANLTDMERAWALQTLKDALENEHGTTVPWSVIEERMHLSTQRRQDLLRLLRFSTEGQELIARHRWSEWTLRDLHMAINADEIDQTSATAILWELAALEDINATILRTFIEQHHRKQQASVSASTDRAETTSSSEELPATTPDTKPARLLGVPKQIDKYRKGIDKLTRQISPSIDETERDEALRQIEQLMASLEVLLLRLQSPQDSSQ